MDQFAISSTSVVAVRRTPTTTGRPSAAIGAGGGSDVRRG
jgi:hypothetical protein